MFHDRSLLGRCFRGFVQPVLEYCSAVWCSAADTHLKLLDRAFSGARFLTRGAFECDIAHRRSVAVLCIFIRSGKAMHPLNGALPGPYVPVWVARGALVTHRYTYAPPRCRTSQYSRIFIPFLSVSLWNDLANPVFDGVRLAGFKSLRCSIPSIIFYSSLLFFLSIGWYCGAGIFGLIGCISLSLSLALPTFFNNNNNINLL